MLVRQPDGHLELIPAVCDDQHVRWSTNPKPRILRQRHVRLGHSRQRIENRPNPSLMRSCSRRVSLATASLSFSLSQSLEQTLPHDRLVAGAHQKHHIIRPAHRHQLRHGIHRVARPAPSKTSACAIARARSVEVSEPSSLLARRVYRQNHNRIGIAKCRYKRVT